MRRIPDMDFGARHFFPFLGHETNVPRLWIGMLAARQASAIRRHSPAGVNLSLIPFRRRFLLGQHLARWQLQFDDAAVIEVQGKRVPLRAGQWSRWTRLDFELGAPAMLPNKHVSGICRFFLQEVVPNLRLYVSPINVDPSAPAVSLSEPSSFVQDVAE